MISHDLLDALQQLNRADKLTVIQMLVGDLAREESAYFQNGATFDVWSPFDAPEAANTLLQLLEDDTQTDG